MMHDDIEILHVRRIILTIPRERLLRGDQPSRQKTYRKSYHEIRFRLGCDIFEVTIRAREFPGEGACFESDYPDFKAWDPKQRAWITGNPTYSQADHLPKVWSKGRRFFKRRQQRA